MTPATLSLYELAAHELAGAKLVLDGGCGSGAGAEVLTRTFPEVVAVDYDPTLLAAAEKRAPKARVLPRDLAAPGDLPRADAVVLIDVLGYAKSPEAVLASLRGALVSEGARAADPKGRLFVAERMALPPQFLAPPARRAFSARYLERLLVASGYEISKWVAVDGTFLVCIAEPFFEPAWEKLMRANGEFAAGHTDKARDLLQSAEKEGTRDSVRLAAAVGLANLSFLLRDADGAVGACCRARDIAPTDVRPAALLARVALAVGETHEAHRLAALAVELDSSDVESAHARAVVASHARIDAKENWLLASNLAPDSLDLAARLASAAIEERDFALAIFALERVRAYGDNHGASIHISLGWALLSAGRQDDALLEARIADQLSPGDPAVNDLVSSCQTNGG